MRNEQWAWAAYSVPQAFFFQASLNLLLWPLTALPFPRSSQLLPFGIWPILRILIPATTCSPLPLTLLASISATLNLTNPHPHPPSTSASTTSTGLYRIIEPSPYYLWSVVFPHLHQRSYPTPSRWLMLFSVRQLHGIPPPLPPDPPSLCSMPRRL